MIKRKVLFVFSLIFIGFSVMVYNSDIATSITAAVAVNQVSDDIVVNSLSRMVARGQGVHLIYSIPFLLGSAGAICSLIPKRKKKDENA